MYLCDYNFILAIFSQDHRLPTVTGVVVPPDLDWKQVTAYMMSK